MKLPKITIASTTKGAYMTDKEYVIYACKTFKFTLIKPTKDSKDILVMQDIKGFLKCIAEGTTWKSIRAQLKTWQEDRFPERAF